MNSARPLTSIASREVYRNRWMRVRADTVKDASGTTSEYAVVERKNFVLVIPVRSGSVLLVKQYRYPIDAWTFEFPQGAIDSESPEEACLRELREETGAHAASLSPLGRLYEASGYATQACHVYLANIDVVGEAAPEATEFGMSAHWFSIQAMRDVIRRGEFQDAPSLAAWAMACEHGMLTT